ncbi:MAG: acetate/propionate family kinase, partial [Planctomycetes bacterium]|nr:acetate/propionate family kinase [Planctomycetota bacterium]
MSDPNGFPVLAINVGSSSLKFALFRLDPAEITLVSGRIQRIGAEGGRIRAVDVEGSVVLDEQAEFADHESAVERVLSCFDQLRRFPKPRAIGHRIVHGGPNYWRPQRVTRNLINALNDWVSLDPDHLPQEIRAIEAVGRKFPELPQVACFDTAFHRAMPRVAQTVPLPAEYRREGIMRYGFHGLSYEYILARLRAEAGEATAGGRVIIAHLGSGASMAAVDKGRPVETTMGLTPLGGLVLSTRCGDLDPGVVLYLLQQQSVSPDAIDDVL